MQVFMREVPRDQYPGRVVAEASQPELAPGGSGTEVVLHQVPCQARPLTSLWATLDLQLRDT